MKGGDLLNMIPSQKKFDEEDYKKNQLAFEALLNQFKFLYPVLREEDFGIDVAIYNGERAFKKGLAPICYIELEQKHHWQGKDFPQYFKDVQFLAKKHKFANLNHPAYWVLFNNDYSNAGIINFRKIVTCELDVVKCKNLDIGHDYFYRIPLDEIMWGIENLERFLIHEAFESLSSLHRLYIS